MHAQRDHARFLVEGKNADYLLFVKEDQPNLYHAIAGLGGDMWSQPYTETGKGHGRVEARTAQVCDARAVSGTASFPHMRQVVRITRGATHAKTGTARSPEVAYAVTSL